MSFSGNELFSFLNTKIASQLNFDDLKNVRQVLVILLISS